MYRFIPGSQGVRVISMIQLDLMISTVLIACSVIAAGLAVGADVRSILVLVAVLLLIEQKNDYPVFTVDRPAENAFLAQVVHIPPSCRVFFAESSRPGPDLNTWFRHNVDSMILAEISGIPTINGFSTFLPPHWNLVHPEGDEYLSNVREWLASHAVTRSESAPLTSRHKPGRSFLTKRYRGAARPSQGEDCRARTSWQDVSYGLSKQCRRSRCGPPVI